MSGYLLNRDGYLQRLRNFRVTNLEREQRDNGNGHANGRRTTKPAHPCVLLVRQKASTTFPLETFREEARLSLFSSVIHIPRWSSAILYSPLSVWSYRASARLIAPAKLRGRRGMPLDEEAFVSRKLRTVREGSGSNRQRLRRSRLPFMALTYIASQRPL